MSRTDFRIEALDAAECAIRDSVGDGMVQVAMFETFTDENITIHGMGVSMAHVDCVIEAMLDDDVVEVCWTDHPMLGPCMAITHQCPVHHDDPLDRCTVYLTNVRPGRGPR